ncbi:MAG TPA: hypothetical protein VEH03_02875 [Burkholderiales bacterium]|nr:hypothetical protein [Burkholderiales bacterium]
MRTPAKAILAPALALTLAACASTHWANDKGEIASQQIISECEHQASARAAAETLASGTYVSAQGGAGAKTGRTEVPWNQAPPPNTGIQEQTFFNLCMKQKGYDLTPAGREGVR